MGKAVHMGGREDMIYLGTLPSFCYETYFSQKKKKLKKKEISDYCSIFFSFLGPWFISIFIYWLGSFDK